MEQQKNHIYEVFTRSQRGDVLAHIGTVEAPTDELAKLYATVIYDEETWAEMCVVRKDDLHWVVRIEGLFAKEGGKVHA
ncbi:hypothetical protein LSG31_15470 [Fodinisporobacter ferrooxydans]|uniref:Phenylacetic acid degradation B n=1 Tax=Fodinisporobacter ferrooxydans TaxID=2901836 RepID=A0ABY4CFJ8_9BACL|nr:hypothetical protein LSG31_15470 [Alicyclobacillaceae bacterium MYW30-H2]